MTDERTFGEIARELDSKVSAVQNTRRITPAYFQLMGVQIECWPEILALYEATRSGLEPAEDKLALIEKTREALDRKAREVVGE